MGRAGYNSRQPMNAPNQPSIGQPIWTRSAQAAGVAVLLSGLLWVGCQSWGSSFGSRADSVATAIDLNRADAAVLMQTPGIGIRLAERIIEHRPYESVDDLKKVPGIGPVTFETIRPYLFVGGRGAESTPLLSKRAPATPKPPAAMIDINTASAAELDALPGIGLKLSQRIVDERARQLFKSVDDLVRVRGIGKKTVEKLRPFATVSRVDAFAKH